MELFHHDAKVDWMGKSKYFYGLSLLLLLVGMQSWVRKGSLDYGIDFKGGTAVYVRFAGTPPVDQLRAGLAQEGLGRSVIQRISDISNADANEVVIYLPQEGAGNQALDTGKAEIDKALHATLGGAESSKQDFNATTESALAEVLVRRDPLALGVNAGDRYTQLARQLISYRDRNARGVIQNFDQLQSAQATAPVIAALREGFLSQLFRRGECGNRRPQSGRRPAAPGGSGHPLRPGRYADLYCNSL